LIKYKQNVDNGIVDPGKGGWMKLELAMNLVYKAKRIKHI